MEQLALRNRYKILIGLLALFLLVTAGRFILKQQDKIDSLTVNLSVRPHTADPYEFDHMVHQAIFPSVLSPLITLGRSGHYQGIIAEKWSSTPDYRSWTFNIRPNLHFSNGTLITPLIVAASLKRIIFLQKKANSQSGLFKHLNGAEFLNNLAEEVEGIRFDNTSLSLSFKEPVPQLLDILSFGLYSIVSPSDYDSTTGEWFEPRNVTSSSGYALSSWTDTAIKLELRKDFNTGLAYPNRAQKIAVVWSGEVEGDIFPRTSIGEPRGVKLDKFKFYGPVPSGVTFLRLSSYKNKSSSFKNKEFRQNFRQCFYKQLEKQGVKVTRSFIPLAVQSVEEFPIVECDNSLLMGNNVTYAYPKDMKTVTVFGEKLMNAFELLARESGVLYRNNREHDFSFLMKNMEGSAKDFDFFNMGTSLRVEEPFEDIKFMFLSKEGIQLPDETGEIFNELKKERFSIQKVNELIWDQALVWPISHFSYGIWVSTCVDMSEFNLLNPSLDFNWIGIKN